LITAGKNSAMMENGLYANQIGKFAFMVFFIIGIFVIESIDL
jgi:hypothetical protein